MKNLILQFDSVLCHVMTAIALAGYLAYGHTLGSCHRRINIIDPGHHPLPIDQQADVLADVIIVFFFKFNCISFLDIF